MADFLRTGVSGLLAFQRALDTTSHNIANVNTPGYSRQRTELGTRPAQPGGNGWVGQGATVQTTRRLYDEFISIQTRMTGSDLGRLEVYTSNAERLNNMFGDSTTGLSATLQNFVNAFQGVANSPASVPARQVLLSEANTLQQRLQSYDSRLSDMDAEVNSRLRGEVAEINSIAQGIAQLNHEIEIATARTNGQPPNDLLDQRDALIDKLSEKVAVNAVKQDGGSVNIFIGQGQPLVVGSNATQLTTVQDNFDSSRLGIAVQNAGGPPVDITSSISGGSIGGLLDFRRQMLDPAHNALGRISVALTEVVNAQHAEGIDLSNNMGGAFFGIGAVEVLPSSLNNTASTATLSVTRGSSGALTERDFILERTGGSWSLRDANTGAAVTMTGTGTVADPFLVDGMRIVVSGTANNGDEFMIRPTRGAVEGLNVRITDPSRIAAAAPIRTGVSSGNTGTGSISAGEVLNASNPSLRSDVTIEFTSATTYSVNGVGSFPYAGGSNIDVNGWRVQISGAPAVGDTFTVSSNTGGSGDNRNALLLADALQSPVLNGGTTSLSSGIGSFVGGIGVATRQSQVALEAQTTVHEENLAAQDSVSGVNLDEEAADMLRFQQAYQAAAQLIRVADTLFQTLLGATQR